jgi:hypothetical protein
MRANDALCDNRCSRQALSYGYPALMAALCARGQAAKVVMAHLSSETTLLQTKQRKILIAARPMKGGRSLKCVISQLHISQIREGMSEAPALEGSFASKDAMLATSAREAMPPDAMSGSARMVSIDHFADAAQISTRPIPYGAG